MKNKLNIGVIPAAGMGVRFGYLSRLLPKTLLPLYNRPILHHVIDHMLEAGVSDIYLIVHAGKERIVNYCQHIPLPNGTKLHFIDQPRLDGLASAILLVEEQVKGRPFLVILGDDCTISNSFPKMIDYFLETNILALEAIVKERSKEILRETNSVKLDRRMQILDIVEKPKKPQYLYRGCGIYLFRPDIFSYIRQTPISSLRNEREITHTLRILAKEKRAYGYFISGLNININDYDDLLTASTHIRQHYKK